MLTRDTRTPEAGGRPMVEISGITKTFSSGRSLFRSRSGAIKALDRVSLTINPGETFGLVGSSGSGKSTLGRLLVRLEHPDSGRILVDGTDILALRGKALRRMRTRIQMICQDPYQSLNPYLTVLDTVTEPLVIHGRGDRRERTRRAMAILEDVGLYPAAESIRRYPHQLSGGQRQRVAIAQAMVLEPDFMVADEPTSMLDTTVSMQIYSLLDYLRTSRGITLLFITHSMAAARLLCHRMAVIHKGVIVETGPAGELIRNPSSAHTRALIQAQPRFAAGARPQAQDSPRNHDQDSPEPDTPS